MSVFRAIVLGIVQGLTEFVPVSSSGHLQLVPWLFGWDDFADNESLEKTFDVALHIGTLAGAIAYFWRDIVRLVGAAVKMLFAGSPSAEGRIAWLLAATVIPAGIVGVLGEGLIEALDDDIWLTAVTLMVFGVLLLLADRLGGTRAEDDFGWRDAAALGLAQACALQPGVSRSGVTVTAARALRFERGAATRLVFLMSIPIIAGAGVYKFLDVADEGGVPADFRAAFAWGIVTSAITGWLAVWGMLRFVRARDFSPFVVYRLVVGVTVLSLLVSSFR